MVFKDFGFTCEYYIFSKDIPSRPPLPREGILFTDSLDYRGGNDNWYHTDHLDIREADGYSFGVLDSVNEWGPGFETRLSDIAKTRYDFIDIGLEVKSVKQDPGLIVCEIIKDGENVAWRAAAIGEFWDPDKRNSWQWAYLCLRLTGIFRRSIEMEHCVIRVYYWNKGREEIELKDFKIRVTEGNQRIYSLIEPLK
jgi:hypothetical protein